MRCVLGGLEIVISVFWSLVRGEWYTNKARASINCQSEGSMQGVNRSHACTALGSRIRVFAATACGFVVHEIMV